MKNRILFCILLAGLAVNQTFSQCGTISMIGEFNGWAEDYPMYPYYQDSSIFQAFIYLDEEDDANFDGIVELKFRQDSGWSINWGSTGFPNGYGIQNGPVLPVPYGNYNVSFDCETLNYFFSGPIGIPSFGQDLPRVSVYPNPATNFAIIEYLIYQPGYVTLEIFNHTGQQVVALADEWQPSGPHQFNWNAEGFPEGMYFFRLSIAENTTSGKLVLR